MSVEPLADPEAPMPPRPAGVVDLGRYRGRPTAGPAVAPPPRPDARAVDLDLTRPPHTVLPEPPPPPPEPLVVLVDPEPEPVPVPEATTRTTAVDGEVVIRRLRLGSVLRMAFGFSLCAYVVVVGAGVLVWSTISVLGVVENLESLAEDLGWVDVSFDGPAMLRATTIGGGILVVAATLLSTVFAEVFNLLSTITGGLRAEVGSPPPSRRARRAAKAAAPPARPPRPRRRNRRARRRSTG